MVWLCLSDFHPERWYDHPSAVAPCPVHVRAITRCTPFSAPSQDYSISLHGSRITRDAEHSPCTPGDDASRAVCTYVLTCLHTFALRHSSRSCRTRQHTIDFQSNNYVGRVPSLAGWGKGLFFIALTVAVRMVVKFFSKRRKYLQPPIAN